MKISEGELFNNTNLEISQAPDHRARLLRERRRLDQARLAPTSSSRSTSRSASARPARSRSAPASRRVENFIAQAQISQNNLFGRGQTLALQAQLSSLRQLFLLRFVEPYFLDTQWTFAFDLYNQSRGFGTFSRNASGGTLTWGYPLSYEARAFLTYKLEDVSITTGSGGIANLGATTRADRGDAASRTCSAAA